MSRRFSQIKRGTEYNQGLDNYIDYLRNAETRPTKRMQGGTRGARRRLTFRYLKPFGLETAADEYYEVRASEDALTALGSAVGARLTTAPANADIQSNKKFKPARVTVFAGSGSATYVQSKITKLYYLKYEGDTNSLPFGATSGTEEEQAGARAVKTAILSLIAASDVKRISFTPERVPV